MGTQFLMDTSAVIKYLSHDFPQNGISFIENFIDTDCSISFISEIELLAWNPANPANAIIYTNFVKQANIIGITKSIIFQTIQIRKNHKLKIPDAIISATAMQNNLTLVGDNDHDFMKVSSLKYINPRTL